MMCRLTAIIIVVGMLLVEHRIKACSLTEMECSTGDQCIPQSWRCDSVIDCYDQSDEDNCNPCSSNPCQHRGTCSHVTTSSYTCSCSADYTGRNCESEVDPCSSDPCLNRATCYQTPGGYRCSCAAGYTGSRCQTKLDPCNSGPCRNGGTCYANRNGYRCSCTAGYTGSQCQTRLDHCNSDPCINGGTCYRIRNGYRCSCTRGYTGSRCQTKLDPCTSRPCENGGSCFATPSGFRCNCASGYTGTTCQTRLTTTTRTTRMSARPTCPSTRYQCRDGKCIPRSYLCDGDRDCSLGEDETLPQCRTTTTSRPTCPSTRYQCRDGKCIPRSYLCDGDRDCSLGEDENLPQCRTTTTSPSTCSPNQYRCGNGKCIPNTYLCDGDRDCSAGEDETGCPNITKCGLRTMGNLETMIINGERAVSGEFPWHAAIYIDGVYRCGGTLLGHKYILTVAGGCTMEKGSSGMTFISTTRIKVYLGSIKRRDVDPKRRGYLVSNVYASKAYTGKLPHIGDFSVIILSTEVTYTSTIHGICLPSTDWSSANDRECFAVGFGLTQKPSASKVLPEILYKLGMRIRPMSVCRLIYADSSGFRADAQMCVQSTRTGGTNCLGDYGGALFCRASNNQWSIRGMYSFGIVDCKAEPNIYTNMYFFRNTVQKIMLENP